MGLTKAELDKAGYTYTPKEYEVLCRLGREIHGMLRLYPTII
jgi:hypothetical protein